MYTHIRRNGFFSALMLWASRLGTGYEIGFTKRLFLRCGFCRRFFLFVFPAQAARRIRFIEISSTGYFFKRLGGSIPVRILQAGISHILKIDRDIEETSRSFDEISGSMLELNTGGKQILEAIARLNDISDQVKDDGRAMENAARENRRSIDEVHRISEIAAERVNTIMEALQAQGTQMKAVAELARRADEISETLESEVKMYQIFDDPEPGELEPVDPAPEE